MSLAAVSLNDKYTQPSGQIYISGIQALVRLPLLQRQLDRQQKLNTAGFISGYRGSPLGGLDQSLWKAQPLLEPNNIVFQPGINEDLAATAVWGSQQTNLHHGALYDGVFGMWYGKGPGVDRCGDVFKHANAAGTSPYGGVLAIAGDDHGAKSSSLPHQSEQAFIAAMMPVLNPAGVQDILDFGLYGWALSRYCGCWVGMKAITECMDSSATVDIDSGRFNIVTPDYLSLSEDDIHIRWPDSGIEQERRLLEHKLTLAKWFCVANKLNHRCFEHYFIDGNQPKLTLVTSGKTYLDTLEALSQLGLSHQQAAEAGIELVKIGMNWPLQSESIETALNGVDKVFVIEEKQGIIEQQLKAQLYHWPASLRPTIIGKEDEHGKRLIDACGETDVNQLAIMIAERLAPFSPAIGSKLDLLQQQHDIKQTATALKRTPHYCAGCPHNSSTVVPEGSRAIGGIGCHYMVQWMDRNTETFTHMGAEGANWIGQSPFTTTEHVFQNLGDGTYFHSGLLAIRAAIAAKVNITYKILYNDAVAMTGGQPIDGSLTVEQLTEQLVAEGINTIAVVSDNPKPYRHSKTITKHADIYHRNDLDLVQKKTRQVKGVSVIIYEQTCAAEKRRRRKRGTMPEPNRHLFINTDVCEGCGDCSKQSNCLAITPVETELGRKRQIDQDSCNKDFSCIKGFCPSFVTITGGRLKQPALDIINTVIPELAEPITTQTNSSHDNTTHNIVIAGIGGTGIVTAAEILGLAAHIDNKHCTTLDMTGLAQKFGAVVSHIRIANKPGTIAVARIPNGEGQLLIGCDFVVSADSDTLATLNNKASAIINTQKIMTAEFTKNPEAQFPAQALQSQLENVIAKDNIHYLNAHQLVKKLFGHSKTLNILLLGISYQNGKLPLSADAIEQAIQLNNQQIEDNLKAFRFGRWLAIDSEAVMSLVNAGTNSTPPVLDKLSDMIEWRMDYLRKYQNNHLAQQYQRQVQSIHQLEQSLYPGREQLTRAVAKAYFKLLAYKDEYEVARLLTDKKFQQQLDQHFEGNYRVSLHFAPSWAPQLLLNNPEKKITVGRWIMPLLKLLANFRFLRNTHLDPFRYSKEHQWERRMISNYRHLLQRIKNHCHRGNYHTAIELAQLPEMIKGYGPIKLASIKKHEEQRRHLLQRFRHPERDIVRIMMPATR